MKWTSNPKINIKQQTQKNYIKPTNLQPINKHIERSSNKPTEMNNPKPISSSLFQSLTNPDPTISASVIHFVNGQIWNITPISIVQWTRSAHSTFNRLDRLTQRSIDQIISSFFHFVFFFFFRIRVYKTRDLCGNSPSGNQGPKLGINASFQTI